MKVLNMDGVIVDVAVPEGFDINALKAGVSYVTGDAAKTFRLRCGKTLLTGKTPDIAAVIEGRTVSMDRISSTLRRAQLRIASGVGQTSYVLRAFSFPDLKSCQGNFVKNPKYKCHK